MNTSTTISCLESCYARAWQRLALGSGRPQELTFQDNLLLAGYRKMAWAMGSGVVLNLGTLLLLAAMTIAGMSVAFPLTLGVALVIGAVWDFANATQANTTVDVHGSRPAGGGGGCRRPGLRPAPAGPEGGCAEGADAGSARQVEARPSRPGRPWRLFCPLSVESL